MDAETTSLCDRLRECSARGDRIGVALGAYGLIHSGTVCFLRRARGDMASTLAAQGEPRACRLFAAVATEGRPAGDADRLLLPEERRRVLEVLGEVDGAGLVGPGGMSLEEWREIARGAVWFVCGDEHDVDADTIEALRGVGGRVVVIDQTGPCTTAGLLKRMAR